MNVPVNGNGMASRLLPFPRPAVAVTVARETPQRKRQFLLIRRATPPQVGSWSIPGGKTELGETSIEAAARELAEETGLTSDSGVRFHPWAIGTSDVIIREGQELVYHYVICQFFAYVNHDAAVCCGDDADDYKCARGRPAAAWCQLTRCPVHDTRGHARGV